MSPADKKKLFEHVPGHRGLERDDVPDDVDESEIESADESESADGYSDSSEGSDDSLDGDDSPFEVFAVETIDKLDTISNALVTDDGTGVADVLADIAGSLRAIAKLLYASQRKK